MISLDLFWKRVVRRATAEGGDGRLISTRAEALARGVKLPPREQQQLAADILVSLLTGAPFLCRLLARDPDGITWLTETWPEDRDRAALAAHLHAHLEVASEEADWMRGARLFRARELARIAARDLLGVTDVEQTTAELSLLAEVCLDAAWSQTRAQLAERYGALGGAGEAGGFAVVALGKLGARELNFSSDIDLLFLYAADGETSGGSRGRLSNREWAAMAGQTVTRLVERQTEDGRLFRVDLRLRPDGNQGPLAFTPAWAADYYPARGEPWERISLLRARFAAGDTNVAADFFAAVEPFLYRHTIDQAVVQALREVKRQITAQLEAKMLPGFDVKLGRGGIRELEFFVQTLQVLNAGRDPGLRQTRTLGIIDRLHTSGLIGSSLRATLRSDYCFLRKLEHRLQMPEDRHTHLLPRDPAEHEEVARRMGFEEADDLDGALEALRERVHLLFQSLFAAEETAEEAGLRDGLAREVAAALDGVSVEAARDILTHWPADHLRATPAAEIADGVRLLTGVTDDDPVAARLNEAAAGRLHVRLSAQDRTGLASVSTGVLAGAGYDIEEGWLFTIPKLRHDGREVGARAVQYLTVRARRGEGTGPEERERLAAELERMVRRWVRGETEEVRVELNGAWVARLQRQRRVAERLEPIDLEIDNRGDPGASIVDLWAEDAPGFLYGFTQALAMRGINVHQTRIRTEGPRIIDRFHLTNRHGRKIITPPARLELEVLAVLIKGFSHFLSRAADPARALTQFDALLDRLGQQGVREHLTALSSESLMSTLATVLGSGAHLFEDFLRLDPDQMLPVLEAIAGGNRAALPPFPAEGTVTERRKRLIAWRDAELFRVDCEHLVRPQRQSPDFAEQLTRLADTVVQAAFDLAREEVADLLGWPIRSDGSPVSWCIMGLGKLGGRELGFASDLELVVVYSEEGVTTGTHSTTAGEFFERAVQALRRNIPARRDGIFELDLRLRPFGSHGPLATSLATFAGYYRPGGGAAAYERQALTRMRWCAGDQALAERVLEARDRFTYAPEPPPAAELLALRERQLAELTRPGSTHLKLGRGGLVEVEYAVQYLQLRHGHTRPELRQSNTLAALEALEDHGVLPAAEAAELRRGYELLRLAIDALRLERGNARDLTLPAPDSRDAQVLARRLGMDAPAAFREIERCMTAVAAVYSRVAGRQA